ncbi:MAG: type II toxin-antitoxin system VapC family toxin [Candidatus Methylomirabilis sp.]|nr:type II toxin-antitoxin system VapC family toxin [Deltaproteobacteria bacterium]
MRFVLDASATLAWLFEDEARPRSESLLDFLDGRTALVPPIWSIEVANALLMAERRGRVPPEKTAAYAEALGHLPVEEAPVGRTDVLVEVAALAREAGLTIYDGLYLHVARREGAPLATLDERMKRAARKLRVKLLTP